MLYSRKHVNSSQMTLPSSHASNATCIDRQRLRSRRFPTYNRIHYLYSFSNEECCSRVTLTEMAKSTAKRVVPGCYTIYESTRMIYYNKREQWDRITNNISMRHRVTRAFFWNATNINTRQCGCESKKYFKLNCIIYRKFWSRNRIFFHNSEWRNKEILEASTTSPQNERKRWNRKWDKRWLFILDWHECLCYIGQRYIMCVT